MRIGRCSNDPKNCTLAGNKTHIPYAGIDSVCPECSAPLAAIASPPQAPPQTPIPPPPPIEPQPTSATTAPPIYAPPQPQQRDVRPDYSRDERDADAPRRRAQYEDDYRQEERAPEDNVMKFTKIAIAGAAIVLLGFAAWRIFDKPQPDAAPELAATASVVGVAGQQVTQISPAQLRRILVATQAFGVPDPAGPVIAQLPMGATLDVSGQINVNGVNWLRVSLPNDSSRSVFVREDQMGFVGDGALAVAPIDPLAGMPLPPGGAAVPGTGAPEIVGPVQPRAPSTFYIASRQANIRQEANVVSAKVGTFEFTDPVTVIGQRMVGARTWYQVQLPSGGTGWINGRLVSGTPRAAPIDAPGFAAPGSAAPKSVPKPEGSALSETGKDDNQAALTAYGPGTKMRVDATTANLRKEPGATGNSVVEALPRDTVIAVEDVRIVNGVPWYQVTSPNGAQGWVSGRTVVGNK